MDAERYFDYKELPKDQINDLNIALHPNGCNLKSRLFRAAHGLKADQRMLFRNYFVPLLTGQPFQLPEPLLVVGDDGRLELLIGDHVVENHGSGPQQWILMAGLLAMSQAAVAGLKEPEAHLSWEAQRRVAKVLGEWVRDQSRPPYQVFVSSHSPLMIDMSSPDDLYYKFTLEDGATRIERFQDLEEFQTRYCLPTLKLGSPTRLLSANLVQLSEDEAKHLGAVPSDRLFKTREDDGSLSLVTDQWIDRYLG